MASKNGCNSDMVKGPVGVHSTRMNPTNFARNGLAKGGVNKHAGGSDTFNGKPKVSKGMAGKK